MKVIRPNDIKIEKSIDVNRTTPFAAVSKLVNVDGEHIQYVKSEIDGDLVDCSMHPLIEAVHLAYASHVPLVLTPDAIWYCIASGVAVHINKNSEDLRSKFVDHAGKKKIEIRRDDFVFASKTNPWHEVVDEFCDEVRERTKGGIVDMLEANYSTTTKVARVASQIVIMVAMQQYFEYCFSTMCGVPEIRVAGEKEDWVKIQNKTKEIVGLIPDLKHWYSILTEILDHFVGAFDGKIDKKFWNEIYKVDGGSGGPYLSGWITGLFPYLDKQAKNRYCWDGQTWKDIDGMFSGLHTRDFNYHMNQVPFKWNYLGSEFEMLFIGGLLGVNVDKADNALTPVFGYAVTEDKRRPQEKPEWA